MGKKKKIEGSILECQCLYFDELIKKNNIKNILEIGFNYGNSTVNFLKNDNVKVLSFDLGRWGYEKYGKQFVDMHYPFKHILILGENDFNNTKKFAHENTIFVVDDTCGTKSYSKGPRKVIDEFHECGIIKDVEHFDNPKKTRHWTQFTLK
jgi:hypothetical protein